MVIKWKMEYDTNQCGTALKDLTFMVLIQYGRYCRIEFSVCGNFYVPNMCCPSFSWDEYTDMQSSGVDIVALKQKL